jgi:P-type conjugative transfer protein TrbL
MPPTVYQYGFLNQALLDFINTIQGVWSPVFQQTGVQILLGLGAIAFAVYMMQLIFVGDPYQTLTGFAMTILSMGVLYSVFLFAQQLAEGLYIGFQAWAQQVSTLSPQVLTPSGVMETGLQLARIFWDAAGTASWFHSPTSMLTTIFCGTVVAFAFAVAAIIYLLALVWVWALIIAGSVLLAFAALPWTWHLFPGWGTSVLSACLKVFFLICVLAIGLNEAQNWTAAMAGSATSIIDNMSLAVEAMIESVLFAGLIYYLPGALASLALGAASSGFNAGEALIGGVAGAGASSVGGLAASAAKPGNIAAAAGKGVSAARSAVKSLLLK